MINYIFFFLFGLLIGVIIGMFRMTSYFHKKKKRRMDCMTCTHFDRWADLCPFCHYGYDKNTDSIPRMKAGKVEN